MQSDGWVAPLTPPASRRQLGSIDTPMRSRTSAFLLWATLTWAQQSPAPEAAKATPDPIEALVGRLKLENYKATIKSLTQFGDRREGTDRNRAALDWIEAQLQSYGCSNTERIHYDYQPAAARGGGGGGRGAEGGGRGNAASQSQTQGPGGSRRRGDCQHQGDAAGFRVTKLPRSMVGKASQAAGSEVRHDRGSRDPCG